MAPAGWEVEAGNMEEAEPPDFQVLMKAVMRGWKAVCGNWVWVA